MPDLIPSEDTHPLDACLLGRTLGQQTPAPLVQDAPGIPALHHTDGPLYGFLLVGPVGNQTPKFSRSREVELAAKIRATSN